MYTYTYVYIETPQEQSCVCRIQDGKDTYNDKTKSATTETQRTLLNISSEIAYKSINEMLSENKKRQQTEGHAPAPQPRRALALRSPGHPSRAERQVRRTTT